MALILIITSGQGWLLSVVADVGQLFFQQRSGGELQRIRGVSATVSVILTKIILALSWAFLLQNLQRQEKTGKINSK